MQTFSDWQEPSLQVPDDEQAPLTCCRVQLPIWLMHSTVPTQSLTATQDVPAAHAFWAEQGVTAQ
jgi:hypothetical protein